MQIVIKVVWNGAWDFGYFDKLPGDADTACQRTRL